MRTFRLTVQALAALLPLAALTAQQQGSSSALKMPEMPSISMPSVGGSFYVPQQVQELMRQQQVQQAQQIQQTQQGKQQAAGTVSAPVMPTAPVMPLSSVTAADSAAAAAKAWSSSNTASGNSLGSSTVSALDISTLNSLGVLGPISNLIGGKNTAANMTTESTPLLSAILSELQQIKQTQAQNMQAVKKNAAFSLQSTGGNPAILRFTANGTDILSSCNTIYFSGLEENGSFLVTGDRLYRRAGRTNTETFYLLFTAAGTENNRTLYTVTPALSQANEDGSSFLYKLSQLHDLSAAKTGNLVAMHIDGAQLKLDLLIDIGKTEK